MRILVRGAAVVPMGGVDEVRQDVDLMIDDGAITAMGAALASTPELPVTVDLEQQTIQCGDRTFRFAIDSVRRTRLLNGWDNIALTESYYDKIAAFKTADRTLRPWATPSQTQGPER